MPEIIKDAAITDSPFEAVSAEEADLTRSNILLPLKVWLENKDALAGRNDIGVWIDADEEVEDLGSDANTLPIIGLNFPTFFDGRSLSSATILRRTYGYEGELRAIGDVRRDQLEQMRRCGINAFQMAEGQDPQQSLGNLKGFSHHYQNTVADPEPLFRQR